MGEAPASTASKNDGIGRRSGEPPALPALRQGASALVREELDKVGDRDAERVLERRFGAAQRRAEALGRAEREKGQRICRDLAE